MRWKGMWLEADKYATLCESCYKAIMSNKSRQFTEQWLLPHLQQTHGWKPKQHWYQFWRPSDVWR